MSDESVIRELEQGQKLKLSAAIRAGKKILREDKWCYLGNGCGCAIGMAAAAYGMDTIRHAAITDLFNFVSEHSELPRAFLRIVENRHLNDESALEIADLLESQGV